MCRRQLLQGRDDALYQAAGIPVALALSDGLCPDHFLASNLEEAKTLGADETAEYEYYYAKAYLEKAMELAAEAVPPLGYRTYVPGHEAAPAAGLRVEFSRLSPFTRNSGDEGEDAEDEGDSRGQADPAWTPRNAIRHAQTPGAEGGLGHTRGAPASSPMSNMRQTLGWEMRRARRISSEKRASISRSEANSGRIRLMTTSFSNPSTPWLLAL